jgi:hypothetical protein
MRLLAVALMLRSSLADRFKAAVHHDCASRRLACVVGIVALALYAAFMLMWHVANQQSLATHFYGDFGRFYYSTIAAAHDGSLYGPSPATPLAITPTLTRQFWNMNPPYVQAMLIPLVSRPLAAAYRWWVILNLLGAAAAGAMLFAELRPRLGARAWFVLGCILIAAAPTTTWAKTGQLTGLLLPLATALWVAARHDRWSRAAVAAGLLIALKPFFAPILILWLPPDRRRTLPLVIMAGLALVVFGAAIYGLPAYVEWVRAMGDARNWLWAATNGSIHAPFAKAALFSELAAGRFPDPSAAPIIVGMYAGAVILGLGTWRTARESSTDRALLIAMLTSLLASPLGWMYYGWLLAGPLAACWSERSVRTAVLLTAPLWMAPFFWIESWHGPLAMFTIGSVFTWAYAGIWLGAMWTPQPVVAVGVIAIVGAEAGI